jgi:septum formation protein
LRFKVRTRPVEEIRAPAESPEEYVRRLARSKADAAWERDNEIVLGADTVVVVEGRMLEKPAGPAEAREMLLALSGRTHVVITGICLRHADGVVVDAESTRVRFVEMEPEEIDEYAASGEPLDKAGGYAIQGLASKFVDRIEGCYFNVMGLPIALVYKYLKEIER